MATAVTNKKDVLRNLVENNASLIKLAAKKFARIEKLLMDENPAASCGTPTPSIGRPDPFIERNHAVSQIRAAFKYKCVVGGFCSTHGWGVDPNHSSTSCGSMKTGHVDTATRKNPHGPRRHPQQRLGIFHDVTTWDRSYSN